MTLLDEVVAERQALDDHVDEVISDMIHQARRSIERSHTCRPVATAIHGPNTSILPLSWNNNWERTKVLDEVNEWLRSHTATASILSYHAVLNNTPALVVTLRTPSRHESIIMPYSVTRLGDVTWRDSLKTKPLSQVALSEPRFDAGDSRWSSWLQVSKVVGN